MRTGNKSAFVTDAHTRFSRSVIQSLGRAGVQITVGGQTGYANYLFASKYCSRQVVYPSPHDEERFIDYMVQEASGIQVLIPVYDNTIFTISKHAQAFRGITRMLVPDHEAVKVCFDKGQTSQLARAIGIPTPQTIWVKELEEIDQLSKKLLYPVIIKWTNEMTTVIPRYRFAYSPDEFIKTYFDMHQKSPYPIVQEIITGSGYGFFSVFDNNSQPAAIFCHKRLREYPLTGGPSTYCESVYEPDLIDYGLRILRALKWRGPAMVEFKHDPRDNQFKLLEINPRFWGSLALAIGAGVDFPRILYDVATNSSTKVPLISYRAGVRCRFLFIEASNLATLLRKRKSKSIFLIVKDLIRSLFYSNTIDGDFQITDLRPTLQQAWLYIRRRRKKSARYQPGYSFMRS